MAVSPPITPPVGAPVLAPVGTGAAAFSIANWAARFVDISSDASGNTVVGSEIDVFDNSGSGSDFTASNSGRRPDEGGPALNGHPAASFNLTDGADSGVAADWAFLGGESTLLWVLNPILGNQGVLWDVGLQLNASNGAGIECFAWWAGTDTGKLRVRISDGTAWVAEAVAPAGSCNPGAACLLSVLVGDDPSADLVIRVNGAVVASAAKTASLPTAAPPSFFRMSTGTLGTGGTQMHLYRSIIGSERLGEADLTFAEAELADEYLITLS